MHARSTKIVPYLISKCFDGKDGTQSNPNLFIKKKKNQIKFELIKVEKCKWLTASPAFSALQK